MRWLIPVLALSVAHAADVPQGSYRDGRIQRVEYSAADVVEVYGSVEADTWIIVGEGETIVKATAAFGEGWHLEQDGRVLTAKPIGYQGVRPNAKEWSTSLNMMTDKGRFYSLYLQYLDGPDELNRAAFRVEYQYTKDAMQAAQQARELQLAEAQADSQKCAAKPSEAVIPQGINYTKDASKNAKHIMPDVVFDDGDMTYLRFPKGSKMPVITLANAGGDAPETIANKHYGTWSHDGSSIHVLQDGCGPNNTAVIHSVADVVVLRAGDEVVKFYRGK